MEVTMGRSLSEPTDDGPLSVSQTDNEWLSQLVEQFHLNESNGDPYVLLSDAKDMLPKEDDDEEDAALVDEEIEKPDDDVPQQRASLINPQSSSAEQAKKLLERFVDLEQPVITEKMSQFMMEPETCRRFVAFISRMRESPRGAGEARDECNLDAVRRSYRTMKILMRRAPTVDSFIAARLNDILQELFNVLDDRSDGLMLHFTHTFDNLIRRDPTAVIQILLADNAALLRKLVDHCYLDGAADAAIAVIRANVNENMLRRRLLDTLRTQGLVKNLMFKSADPDPEVSSNASENLDKVCEALHGDVAMPFLLFDPASFKETAALLTKTFCAVESTGQQKFDCIKALQSTYMHWRRITKQGASDAHYPDTFADALVVNLPSICDGVVDISSRRVMQHKVALNAYSVSNSLSLLRLTAIRLVFQTLTKGDSHDADPKQLETIPASFWKLLTTLFLTHEHSSIFHALFYRMFDMVMKSGSEATVKNFLGKPKLVTRMLELYDSDKSHSSRGYMLLLFNYLRIVSEAQPPSSYLNNLLSGNPKWLEMAAQLDDQTKRNFTGTLYEKGLTSIRPELHMGPRLVRENGSGPGAPVNSTMQAMGTPQAPPSYAEITGSEEKSFADSFKQHVGLTDIQAAAASTGETGMSEMDVDALAKSLEEGSAGGEGGGGHAKKKKKKKKKKTSGASSESSSSPGHSGEEDEVDISPSDPLVH